MAKVCQRLGCGHIATHSKPVLCDSHWTEAQQAKRYQRSDASKAIQKLYTSRRWAKIRADHLKAHPYCQCPEHEGKQVRGDSPEYGGVAIVDHITPHRGNERLFWYGRRQTLTKRCHDSYKQRHDKA